METMLKVSDLYVSYGHIEALRGVSVEVKKGQIVSIIGANGAGKSTLLRTISGLVKPKSGGVEFEGEVLPKKPSKIVGKGVVHVPEGRKCFSGLTIQDNLLVGGYLFKGKRLEEDLKEQYDRFSDFGTEEKSVCRYVVRWRAADACSGKRLDEPTKDTFT